MAQTVVSSPPPFGVYTPLVTFMNEDETLDYESTKQHALRMARGGVRGIVLQGSNGEAPHLLHSERQELVQAIRQVLYQENFQDVKLIVGCGAPSVQETLLYISEAKASGADYALVLPPSYWVAAMSARVIEEFYLEIASKSTLPILIYNFPGVTGGIDISSDLLISLAKANPMIVGAKLTCGNVGKLQRVSTALSSTFAVFAGKSDFFLPGLVAGSNGVIAALANLCPSIHCELLRRYQEGDLQGAQTLQQKLSDADWELVKGGVAGVKAVVAHFYKYGSGKSRKPLGHAKIEAYTQENIDRFQTLVKMEKDLNP